MPWTAFLQQHARTLDGELSELFPHFTMDLRTQIHASQLALELRSSHVLQILQQKDSQIDALQRQLDEVHNPIRTRDVGVQIASLGDQIETKHEHSGRDERGENDTTRDHQIEAMRSVVEEQQEQIEVLLDELERRRQQLEDARVAYHHEPKVVRRDIATSTDPAPVKVGVEVATQASAGDGDAIGGQLYRPDIKSSDTPAGLSCLERQLRALEAHNHDLQCQRELISHDKSQMSDGVGQKQLDAVTIRLDVPARPARVVAMETESPFDSTGVLDPKPNDNTVEVAGGVNADPVTHKLFRSSAEFEPSCEEASFSLQPDRLNEAQSTHCSAEERHASSLQEIKIMEEKEVGYDSCWHVLVLLVLSS